ncbi:DUF2304 domain-containing protein [Aquibacillus rhizosphaerae]|uniref:DUF2304 domain-containing protein n=1 Tax=Aquibacillus rhizosphaerae TaxID=3051431 RepID=A0ABT7KZX5_9BACI|nr:DUF2304 domain-containing protein [Aquibacillus sp. LR5S19]MDL4839111.1 DUF2304 domain-containing protein [Aquibacillus sp. LR5S19]
METVQLISIISASLFLAIVVTLTARNRLNDQQAFMWMVFAIGALLVALFLPWLNKLATTLGVSYMPTLVFMSAFFIVLSLLIFHTIVISKQQEKVKRLVQEVAFLSKEFEDYKKETDTWKEKENEFY